MKNVQVLIMLLYKGGEKNGGSISRSGIPSFSNTILPVYLHRFFGNCYASEVGNIHS